VTSPTSPQNTDDSAAVNLGLRMRVARKKSGMSLRELARRLGVSPSFISQIENGKSRPSVATLYSLAQVLEVSIDHLFESDRQAVDNLDDAQDVPGGDANGVDASAPQTASMPKVLRHAAGLHDASEETDESVVRRSDLGSLEHLWQDGAGNSGRLSVTAPGNRMRLVMDSGVIWEQLATNTAHQIDFIEVLYPAGSSSTSDERMLRHDGFEYGYLLEGELEVTFGFETFTLHAGEALGLNSSVPHLFRNRSTEPARGIWFVHHDHQ
jgi:transcriptional regulator with XRE-family HTH domain